jgi:hypothetical protein
MENQISENFAEFLKGWIEETYGPGRGGNLQAAKFMKISPSHLNNILAGRRATKEEFRRAFASKIGITYEEMINIETAKTQRRLCEPTPNYQPAPEKNLKTIDTLLQMTREVLESDTDYAESLSANVRSFHNAVQTQKRLNRLEAEVFDLKSKLHAIIVNDRRKKIRRQEQIEFEGPDRRINPDRRGR